MALLIESLKTMAKKAIGNEHRQGIRKFFRRVQHFGLARSCPCCNASLRRFAPFGLAQRPDARCPVCGSLERHRLMHLFLTQKTDLFNGQQKRLLHVAPEPHLGRLFQKADYIDYLSADLFDPGAMVKMDVTDVPFPDGSFDVIFCSHVLEHVPDDRRAMREFCRILKPGGWAILQVPISAPATFEDPTVTDPKERERLFGQDDHVRLYGPDYRDRLVEAGFTVTVDGFVRDLDDRTVCKLGLMRSEDVYFCRKPA